MIRLAALSGVASLRPARQFLAVQAQEIHRVQVQRREAAIAGQVRHDPAHEREQHPRAFDQKERMKLFLGHALDMEDAAVIDLHQEHDLAVDLVLRGDLVFLHHLELVICRALAGIQRDLHLNVGLHFAAGVALHGKGVLETQIPDELRDNVHAHLRCGAFLGHSGLLL